MPIAAGVIVGWPSTAGSIPAGWTRVTTLDDKHVKGVPTAGTNPGTTGGSATHTHTPAGHAHGLGTHVHGPGTPTAPGTVQAANGSTASVASQLHTHGGNSSTSANTTDTVTPTLDSPSNDPARLDVIWIQSNGTPTGIPVGAITWFNETGALPTGWTQHAAGNARFLKGAVAAGNGGGTGGTTTHTHTSGAHTHTTTHSHPAAASGGPSATSTWEFAGVTSTANSTHTHQVTHSSTVPGASGSGSLAFSSNNHEPPFYTLALAANTSAGVLNSLGTIALWAGTIASIPSGWKLCDGTNGTPNLLGKFVKAATTPATEVGVTGGATTHSHTGVNHNHSVPSHLHSRTYGAASVSTGALLSGGANNSTPDTHTHAAHNSAAITGTTADGAPASGSNSNEPPYVEVAFIQFQGVTLVDLTGSGGIVIGDKAPIVFVPFSTAQVNSDIVVEWDFDNDGDFSDPKENITAYVMSAETLTGRDWPSQLTGKAGPGKFRATLLNEDDRFSYFNTASPLNQAPFSLKTGRKLRVRTSTAGNPDPTLLARDRFNRANGALGTSEVGGTWTSVLTAGISIESNQAKHTINVPSGVVLNVGTPNCYAQVKVSWNAGVVGLIYRYQDDSNYSRLVATSTGIDLINVVAGTPTTIDTQAVEIYPGLTIGVLVSGSSVTGYVEGVALVSGTAVQTDETRVGLFSQGGAVGPSSNLLDDFYVWAGLPAEIEGILWTGDLSDLTTTVVPGPRKLATIEGEGWLSRLATQKVNPPSTVSGRKTGILVGSVLSGARLLHPPGSIDEGDVTTGPFDMDETDALEAARRFEETEFGFLYESQEGPLGYDSRTARNSAAAQATFSDAPGAQFSYSEIAPFDWRREVVNRVFAGVAGTAPTVTSVTTLSSLSNGNVTMPATVLAGELLLVIFLASPVLAGAPAVPAWVLPLGWTEVSRRGIGAITYEATGDELKGGAGRVYAKVADGTEDGTIINFCNQLTPGMFEAGVAVHTYRITNWYGSLDGVQVGDFAQGSDPSVVFPSWGISSPSLMIAARFGAAGGGTPSVSGTVYPRGYGNGISTDTNPGGADGTLQTAYKQSIGSLEDAGSFAGTFTGFDLIESAAIAIRGFDGSPPGSGIVVQADDIASQDDHNAIRTHTNSSDLFASTVDATAYANLVLATHAGDRPILELSFWATRSGAYRQQAIRRRVSDKIAVVASNDTGLGISGDYFIESINHQWTDSGKLWKTTWTLSPA